MATASITNRNKRGAPSRQLLRGAGIALIGVLVGGLVLQNGAARSIGRTNPALALVFAPNDARNRVLDAAAGITDDAKPDAIIRARMIVEEALLTDATLTNAARTFGITMALKGDGRAATRAMIYAERLSRRDLATEVWLIEDRVQSGDVEGALSRFDVGLRTSQGASPILMPILVNATADRQLIIPIARLLATRPPWLNGYVEVLTRSAPSTDNAAALLAVLARRHVAIDPASLNVFIDRLISEQKFALALQVFDRHFASPGVAFIRNGGFEKPDPGNSLSWTYVSDADRYASRAQSNGGNTAVFRVNADSSGPVLSQLLVLPPGLYALRGTSEIDGTPPRLPAWSLVCTGSSDQSLGVVPIAKSSTAAPFNGTFRVPATGCPAQKLTLTLYATDLRQELNGSIDNMAITRLE